MPAESEDPVVLLQRMVQHAMALEKGATYKEIAAVIEPPKEEKSFVAKITSFLRGT